MTHSLDAVSESYTTYFVDGQAKFLLGETVIPFTSLITLDPDEYDWYSVPNLFHDEPNYKFVDRIWDAFKAVEVGIGDAIVSARVANSNVELVKSYVDRDYGEEIRKATLDFWGNKRFAYTLKLSGLGFGGSQYVSTSRQVIQDETLESPIIFSSYEEALVVRDSIRAACRMLIEDFNASENEEHNARWSMACTNCMNDAATQMFDRWRMSQPANLISSYVGDIYRNGECLYIAQIAY